MHMLMNKVDYVTVAERKQYLPDVESLVASLILGSIPPIPLTPFHPTRRLLLILETKLSSILKPRYLYSWQGASVSQALELGLCSPGEVAVIQQQAAHNVDLPLPVFAQVLA